MILGKAKKDKVIHVSEVPVEMRIAIKSVIDASTSDLPRMFGLRYSTPKPGDQVMIPFADLDGKFSDVEDAYTHLLKEIEENRDGIITSFREKVGSDREYIDHFRISYYSYVDQNWGMVSGILADPTESLRDPYNLESEQLLAQEIKGKNVLVANTALGSYVGNRLSPLWKFGAKSVQTYDSISPIMEDILNTLSDTFSTFHREYDKEGTFSETVASDYMRRAIKKFMNFSNVIEGLNGLSNIDVILVPVISIPKEKWLFGKNLKEAWSSNKMYSLLMETGKLLELEAWPYVIGLERLNESLAKLKTAYQGRRFVLLSDKPIPPINTCSGKCEGIPAEMFDMKPLGTESGDSRVHVFEF